MKILNTHQLRYQVLRILYWLAPFDIKGGLEKGNEPCRKDFISCLIISNKISLLNNLLEDLKSQTFPKDQFEVVVVFDGQGVEILNSIKEYKKILNIVFHQTPKPLGILSNLRNISVSLSRGEFFLFLDDDTRIFQKDFLERAMAFFKEDHFDILIPQAHSLYGVVRARYDFLDKFSFTNRCSLYRRTTIEDIGGFLKNLQTYEDTELSIRLMIKRPRVVQMEELNYYHPPLFFDSMRKPLAIGQTIFQMRQYYSIPVWLLTYFNALRFLPYGLIPGQRYRQWFKISLGVLLYPFRGKSYYY